jgi:hypothetical protein
VLMRHSQSANHLRVGVVGVVVVVFARGHVTAASQLRQ